jgi:hypothetical protein
MRETPIHLFLAVAAISTLVLPLPATDSVPAHTQRWEFAAGQRLRVHFRAGDLKIVEGADATHITLRYTAERHHQDVSDRVHLSFESRGPDVFLSVTAPNNVNLEAVLEVPAPVTLDVRMFAGDLTVERVKGSKSLQTHFGDITVVEPKDAYPHLYRSIEASTRIGDVSGLDFNQEHGWLGHVGEFVGQGSYDLQAHVGTGDINFQSQ